MKTNKCKRPKLSPGNSVLGVIVVPLLALAFCTSASAAVHYVNANGASPLSPYSTWPTAAITIQDAVDVAVAGDEILVTNGLYATGGRPVGTNLLGNRVAVDKPLTLRSVNGPEVTIIQGYQVPDTGEAGKETRCAFLAAGAVLSGFTLTNGSAWPGDWPSYQGGGGIFSASPTCIVSNCIIVGNSAFAGGGVQGGTVYNCVISNNLATGMFNIGGGAVDSVLHNCLLSGNFAEKVSAAAGCALNNCTLVGNSCGYSGSVGQCTLNNCILYGNTPVNWDPQDRSTFRYCCTTPMPTNGIGNITNAPLFLDAATGNYRLRPGSPCINVGNNLFVGTTDLDGNPRIVSGTVDMGAYEYQGTTNTYTFIHASYTRTYSVYLPSTCSRTNAAPLMLQLTPNAAVRAALYGMNRIAEREAFLVAYPDPYGDNWFGPARTDPYDDVGFLLEVIRRVSADYSVKATQVYAGGYSAGGVMSECLGRLAPYKLAAVASVAAVRPYVQGTTNYMPLGSPATPCRPFPFLHIHGTADTIGPYGGGYSQGWNWPPAEQVVADYVRSNGCALTPSTTNLPNLDLTDGCTIQLLSYTNGHTYLDTDGNARKAEVLFYRVVGGGHSWPGDYPWQAWALPVNRDIDASEEIWTFFRRHRTAAAPAGRFESSSYSVAEGFQSTFRDAAVGLRYRIQVSTSTFPGSWTDFTNITYTAPVVIRDTAAPATGNRFYRAVCP